MIINYMHSRKTQRDYAQFGPRGYLYEVNDIFYKKDDSSKNLGKLNSKDILFCNFDITDESELIKYAENELYVVCPENRITLVNRTEDTKHAYLKIGYNRFVPIEKGLLDEFLTHPVLEQFDVRTVNNFLEVLPEGALNAIKSNRIEDMIDIRLFLFKKETGGYLTITISGCYFVHYMTKEACDEFIQASLINHMFNITFVNKEAFRSGVFDEIEQLKIDEKKKAPIIYEKLTNTLVGVWLKGFYQIFQIDFLELLNILPKSILVSKDFC